MANARYTTLLRFKFVLTGFMVFLGCRSGEGDVPSSDGIFIDITRDDEVSWKDLFSKIELVPLETRQDVHLYNADKVLLSEGHFYILDEKGSAVFIFTDEGKYVRKIQQVGRGPGEYLNICDMLINPHTNTIDILSPFGEVLSFDREGNFVSRIRLPKPPLAVHYFAVVDEDIFAFFSGTDSKRVFLYSQKADSIVYTDREIPPFISSKTYLNPPHSVFTEFGGGTFYFEPFSNDVFRVTADSLEKVYSWDFGRYNFHIHDLDPEASFQTNVEYLRAHTANAFLYNLETDRQIYTSVLFDNKWKTILYDKNQESYHVFDELIEGVRLPWGRSFGQGFYFGISAPHASIFVSPEILDAHYQKIYQEIAIEDNPVIIMYYF